MDEIATTSSSEEGSQSSLESETFQSAQRPQEVENREQEELFAENDELSDTSSADEKACPEPLNKEDQLSLANSGDKAQLSAIDDEAPVAPDDGLSPSPQLPTRPNRYRGSASTWRNWTAPERDLAASLDQLRAKDLSIHLYNAFKLKQKASTLSAQQGSTDEGTAVEEAWAPPKVWTAWPLPPKYVPREDDERQWEDKEASSKPKPMKPRMPGETLRELLVAQVLRKAKERFAAREWEEEDDDDDDGKESTGLRPVILADDEQAMEILRPSIQHVLKNIDTVLMGLHIARSACLPINEDTDESDLQGQERKSISKSRGRKRRRDASTDNTEYPKSSSRRSTSESDEVVSGAASSATSHKKRPGSYSRNSSRTFHKRKSRLGLRDWSEVLGIASMTGCDSAVIEKAATRCSALFGEGISFRTLYEGRSEGYVENVYLPGNPVLVRSKKVKHAEMPEEEMVGGVHVDGFLKPIEGKKSWKYGGTPTKRRGRPPKSKS